jgi:DNA-binding response OmpR family regulator
VTAVAATAPAPWAAATGRSAGPERERRLRAVPEPGEVGRREGDPRGAQVARHVLVVDDEASMRTLCRINLELAGFEVSEAADGAEALERAREQDVDLILLDVMLPDIGGHEVAEQLAADERTRNLPVAFLSARAAHEDLRRGYRLGAVDYITKPFDPVGLGERVQDIVGRIERGESERFRAARLAELED